MRKTHRLAVLNSHPVQYFAPLYRRIAQSPDIDLTVYYCSRQGLDSGHMDPGFGKEIVWDVPLLEGYRYKFLANIWGDRGVKGFFSLLNPGIISETRRGHFDAIILHGHNFATNMLALLAAKLVGTRVFMRSETHLLLHRRGLKKFLRKPVMTMFYKLCDACLYLGTLNKAFYRAHKVPEQRLFAVPYTVNNDFFIKKTREWAAAKEEIKAEIGVPHDLPIILYASKFSPRKRPWDLLKAYEKLRAGGTAAALVCVGDGSERAGLEAYTHEHRIPDVHFLGFRNQTELPKYYATADVFALPSENEPWGLVINEVMCAGVPVITTREVGAAADLVIDGKTGFTYDCGDVEGLRRAMEAILTKHDLRRQMRHAAIEVIREWNYDMSVAGIREALMATARAQPREGE